jgi:4-hydroxy-tetrahydrodipicolinate reductase
MQIGLSGYGKMGRMVEQSAQESGLEVTCVVDPFAGSRGDPGKVDVWIDFSEPAAVLDNISRIVKSGAKMVVGTTGWYDRLDYVRQIVDENKGGLVYGSNFSIGVNLMFQLVQRASELFKRFDTYDPFIEEAHHKFKKDAPSGTGVFLKRIMDAEYNSDVPAFSTRGGYLPGTHTVSFDSEADTLSITHRARSRAGFASGAIVAARWIEDRKGLYEFSEVIAQQMG